MPTGTTKSGSTGCDFLNAGGSGSP
jgi:hypothetical protein